ncbi:DUF1016 N-terminal domain-containing protein [Kineococcus sp. SYSU DK018]|uniref:DUF1016 N-terminal domain-containing protein n=1 Tax=Kineococcus sp. SYSU DK018 TaxID=3383139 RepID=UPI003D7D5005
MLERQHRHGWGAKVIDRLAIDLRAAFPDQRGFSRRNLHSTRAFAAAWPTGTGFVPQPVAQLPRGHVRLLLDRLDQQDLRQWYAASAVQQGGSRAVLEHQIATRLHPRRGAAPSNFTTHLPPPTPTFPRTPYVFASPGPHRTGCTG